MKQQTLAMAADAQSGFEQHRKPTRRDEFLKTMDALVPWAALCDEIAPHYPKAGNGRPPINLCCIRIGLEMTVSDGVCRFRIFHKNNA